MERGQSQHDVRFPVHAKALLDNIIATLWEHNNMPQTTTLEIRNPLKTLTDPLHETEFLFVIEGTE